MANTIQPYDLTLISSRRKTFALVFILLTIVSFTASRPVFSQIQPTLDSLEVELWPDYDQPSMLVLITGVLAEDVPLPATFTVPLPMDANVHAVARVDQTGAMFSDIDFDDSTPGSLTLTATDPVFRIEYYAPYTAEGSQRSYVFDWQADVAVTELLATVQQPAMADEIELNPPAVESTSRNDGLLYHNLAPRLVAPGQDFQLDISYELANPQLSAGLVTDTAPVIPSDVINTEEPEVDSGGLNWPIIVAGAAIGLALVAGVWLLATNRRSKRRTIKPRPARRTTPSKSESTAPQSGSARFCHECGRPLDRGDKFCRSCGTPVKGS